MNDEMYLEYARGLAELACGEAASVDDRVRLMFRRLVTRPPTAPELQAIIDYWQSQKLRLEQGELDAATIAARPSATPEDAAWVMVARALMNLDEVITRP